MIRKPVGGRGVADRGAYTGAGRPSSNAPRSGAVPVKSSLTFGRIALPVIVSYTSNGPRPNL